MLKWYIIGMLFAIGWSLIIGNVTSEFNFGYMPIPFLITGFIFCFIPETHSSMKVK